MTSLRFLRKAFFLSVFLFLKSSEALHTLSSLSIDDKTLNEIITPIIISAIMREVRGGDDDDQDKQEDNESSPQHQQPFFIPLSWHPMHNHPMMQHQPYQPQMLPLMHSLPLPLHHHAHPHPHLHGQSHPLLHQHPLQNLHPQQIAIIPHQLVPLFQQQVVAQIIQQLEQPVINHQHVPGMQSLEIVDKLPMWISHMPQANPMFHQHLNYAPLLNH